MSTELIMRTRLIASLQPLLTMKHNWEYKRLGDVCDIVNGFAFKSELFRNYGIPILRISNIQNDTVNTENLVYCDSQEYKVDLSKFIVKFNDIVMALSGATTGKVGVNNNHCEFYLNQRTALFKNIIISRRFLFYELKQEGNNILNKAFGVAQPNISTSKLEELMIPVPPMEVQEQIVAELDKINEVIGDCRELLRNLDALAQSLFYDTFGDPVTNPKGWKVKTLGDLGNIERGAGISKKDFVDNGAPCIHYGQLHTSCGPITKVHKSCISKNLIAKPKIAHKGDLIMAITSEDVEGSCKSTVWLGDYDIIVGSDAAIFHHKQNGVFLSYYTMSKAFYYAKARYAKGFKVTHISAKEIESIPIFVPPLSLQEKFASRIEQIDAQKKAVEETMENLQTLLNSRMDYWFN